MAIITLTVKLAALLILTLTAGLILRLLLAPTGYHVDIYSNAGWGEWIYAHGPYGFYENSIWTYAWPTQPPLVSLIYGWDKVLYVQLLGNFARVDHIFKTYLIGIPPLSNFVTWFAEGKVNIEIPFQAGYLSTIKLLPILADLILALVIYRITRSFKVFALILFIPFSWYISALWGQYDSLAFMFNFLGILALRKKSLVFLSPILFMIGIFIKPTGLILAPLYSYYFITSFSKSIWQKMLGVVVVGIIFFGTIIPFTKEGPIHYSVYTLKRIVFDKAERRLTTNAYNFWHIFSGNTPMNEAVKVGFIPANIIGLIAFVLIHIFVIRKRIDPWLAWFMVSTGGWLALTNMLDRYMYAGMIFGLMATYKLKKALIFWIVMGVIFSLNLYRGWWFPQIPLLQGLLDTRLDIPGRVLSVVNVAGFCIIVYLLVKKLRFKSA